MPADAEQDNEADAFKKEANHAAVFDFDGALYNNNARWKIADARLGVVGSRIAWDRGLEQFDLARKKFPGLLLGECFTPDEFEFETVRELEGNVTLPGVLMKTAQNHVFRGHDIYILSRYSFRDFMKVTERFMGDPGPLPMKENPFDYAKLLTTEDYSVVQHNSREGVQAKFFLLQDMLRYDDLDAEPPRFRENSALPRYEKIFLYYTEDDYPPLIEPFVREKIEALSGGRNTFVLSYIADLENARKY